MAIAHVAPGEVISLFGPGGTAQEHTSAALFKGRQLEVIRMAVAKGKQVPKHQVPGEVTVQCLAGRVELSLADGSRVLAAGQWLHLAPSAEHALNGLEDSILLVTIAL